MASSSSTTLYVSPPGNDGWSGRLAEPDPLRGDGPLATLGRARDLLRGRRKGSRATVRLRGGHYSLPEPLVLEPGDSGLAGTPVVYEACRGETPVLDAGRPLTGWHPSPDLDGPPPRARGRVHLQPGSPVRALIAGLDRLPGAGDSAVVTDESE